MLKTCPKGIAPAFLLLGSLLFIPYGRAQDIPFHKKSLTTYIQELEARFDIKFSYVDEDLRPVEIQIPNSTVLADILQNIQDQTQIKIRKLSERYYALSKNTTVDVCAIVLDNYENNTLPGATVSVLGSSIASITNRDGVFSFKDIPRKAVIQIKHLGFKPLFIVAENLANHNPCTALAMAQSYQELDEVVVIELLTTGLVKKTDASILLSTSEFGILPGATEPDILQAVQSLPGIKSTDETVSDINIRGGTNDQNLILWDGIKMYQSGHFFGLISAFNPYLTDKVTLIKNGASSQYGDGVSGIIDMGTKNKIPEAFSGGAGFNLISGDAYALLPINQKLAFQFSARRSLTDFLNTPTYDKFSLRAFQDSEVTQNNDFYFYDFTGKILYDLNDSHKVRFSFIHINNELDYSETGADGSPISQSKLDQTNLSFGGSLDSEWSSSFSTSANLYYTRYDLDSHSSMGNGEQRFLQKNQVIETSLKLNTHYRLGRHMSWLNGYQLSETGILNATDVTQPPFKSDVTEVMRIHSLYSEIGYGSVDKRLMFKGGIRANSYENLETFNEIVIEPRLNINYELTDSFSAQLLGEYRSQATNQVIDLEQNFLGVEKRRWILSDGNELPLIKSKQASLGFNFDRKNLYVGLEGFYKEVNGISTRTQGFQNPYQFNGEIGRYHVKGIEFLINKRTVDYSAWFSYAYNLNDYTFQGIVPNSFPNNLDIRHTLTLAGTYIFDKFKFSIGLNYRTGKPYTQPLESDPINTSFFPSRINYEEPNSSRLPEYVRADVSAIYDFNLGQGTKASVGASILNFTNRENILNTYYRLKEGDEIETVQNVSLGLTPNLSFRVMF